MILHKLFNFLVPNFSFSKIRDITSLNKWSKSKDICDDASHYLLRSTHKHWVFLFVCLFGLSFFYIQCVCGLFCFVLVKLVQQFLTLEALTCSWMTALLFNYIRQQSHEYDTGAHIAEE